MQNNHGLTNEEIKELLVEAEADQASKDRIGNKNTEINLTERVFAELKEIYGDPCGDEELEERIGDIINRVMDSRTYDDTALADADADADAEQRLREQVSGQIDEAVQAMVRAADIDDLFDQINNIEDSESEPEMLSCVPWLPELSEEEGCASQASDIDNITDDECFRFAQNLFDGDDGHSIINLSKVKQMRYAYGILSNAVKDSDISLKYEVGTSEAGTGNISLIGEELEAGNPTWLLRVSELATEMQIYPREDKMICLSFIFRGLTRNIQEINLREEGLCAGNDI